MNSESSDSTNYLDSIAIRILWDRLVSIVDQATSAHKRTAFSTLVREANDFAATLLTADGNLLVNAESGLPPFVAAPAFALQHLLTEFPASSLREGDVLISNDPWIAAGQALDIVLLQPLFRNGRIVAFAGSMAHSPDLGGAQRWNRSFDVFDEALRIPNSKLFSAGELNRTLFEVIRYNSRLPDLTIGDLEAQLAALHVLNSSVMSMMDEYELEDLDQLIVEIFTRSEAAMRNAIADIPDGVYIGEIESDGFPDPAHPDLRPEPILIRATVTVRGTDLDLDFTGSSGQRPGPFNGVWTICQAYASYAIRAVLVPFLPNNDGFYRAVTVTCPEGTVVNASFPAPTLSRHVIASQVCDAAFQALARVIPTRVIAPSGNGPPWSLALMGEDRHGRRYHRLVIISGGHGATAERDGETFCFPGNAANTPVETMESLMPVVWECKEIIPDSGGPGEHRGGVGQRMVLRPLLPLSYSMINGRVGHVPPGLLGGRAGRPGRFVAAGSERLPGCDGSVQEGETLVIETPGGAGWGAPSRRDRYLLENDIAEGIVLRDAATRLYGPDLSDTRRGSR
jgi:N-methylhydantoinase B